MRGVFAEMKTQGFPAEVVEAIRGSVDCNLEFFGTKGNCRRNVRNSWWQHSDAYMHIYCNEHNIQQSKKGLRRQY